MSLNIYLMFNGNAEEAMNHYKDATGGTIEMMNRFGDSPMPVDEEVKNKVMHGIMKIADTTVMFSDTDGKRNVNFGDNFSIALDFKDEATMQQNFDKLAAGGVTIMPLQDTFWGAKFGMCTDKFGVNWMFNHDKPKGE